jgi:hypothetical protein
LPYIWKRSLYWARFLSNIVFVGSDTLFPRTENCEFGGEVTGDGAETHEEQCGSQGLVMPIRDKALDRRVRLERRHFRIGPLKGFLR